MTDTWDMTYDIVLPQSEYLDELAECFDFQWYPAIVNIIHDLIELALTMVIGANLISDDENDIDDSTKLKDRE